MNNEPLELAIQEPPIETNVCKYCDGNGYEISGNQLTICFPCNGKGVITEK